MVDKSKKVKVKAALAPGSADTTPIVAPPSKAIAKKTAKKPKESDDDHPGAGMLPDDPYSIDDFIASAVSDLKAVTSDGATQLLGSNGLAIKIKSIISTQCPSADEAIGRGGIPTGRLTIIHGGEAAGKTTFCLHVAAETQQRGGLVVYLDKEYKLDPDYASKIGVNVERMILSQPDHLEQAMEVILSIVALARRRRVETGKEVPILIILDSMNATISKAEFDGTFEQHHMAAQARVFSKSLPKIIPLLSEENIAMLWVSQIRDNVGVMFGSKDTLSGGRSPKFYASVILEVKNKGQIKSGDEVIGNETEMTVRKNQIAPPFKKATYEIYYGSGIDFEGSLLEVALKYDIVEKAGSWYKIKDGEKLGQGKANAAATLRASPALKAYVQEGIEAVKEAMKKGA